MSKQDLIYNLKKFPQIKDLKFENRYQTLLFSEQFISKYCKKLKTAASKGELGFVG